MPNKSLQSPQNSQCAIAMRSLVRRTIHWCVAVAVALAVASCGGSRPMPSQGTDPSLAISKKEFVSRMAEAQNGQGVRTYYARNVATTVNWPAVGSVPAKCNLFFERGGSSVINLRAIFPPVSVGRAELRANGFRAKSKFLNFNMEKSLDVDANTLVQDALLGRVPDVFRFYRGSDFSGFDVCVSPNNLYCLTRSFLGFKSQINVNPDGLTLADMRLEYKGTILTLKNTKYATIDNRLIPTEIQMNVVLDGMAYSLVLKPENVTFNGSEKLDY